MNAKRDNYECRILNYELGWREVGIAPLAIAQHFSLCTFHFSLPEGTAFHFPKGHFSLPAGTAVRRPMQHAPMASAARCVGTCTVLRFPGERSPFLYKAASVGTHSIPPQPFHPVAGPVKAAHKRGFAPCISLRHTAPCPAPSLLGKAWRQYFCPKKQAVRTSPGTSAPPGAIV